MVYTRYPLLNYIPLPCRQLTVLDLSRSPNAPRVSSKSHPLSHSTFSFLHLRALSSTSGANPHLNAVRHCSLHLRPVDVWSLVPTRIASRYFLCCCLFLFSAQIAVSLLVPFVQFRCFLTPARSYDPGRLFGAVADIEISSPVIREVWRLVLAEQFNFDCFTACNRLCMVLGAPFLMLSSRTWTAPSTRECARVCAFCIQLCFDPPSTGSRLSENSSSGL
jgi:hypothetical protein